MSRDIESLEPVTRDLCRAFLSRAEMMGIRLLVVQALRTPEEQDALYQKGRTRPGEPCHHALPPRERPVGTCSIHPLGATVTNAKPGHSKHETGHAFDVAFRVGEKEISWTGPWDQIGNLGELLGLKWGGRWKVPDRPHFET